MEIVKTNSLRWLSLEDLEGEKWKDIPWANGLYSVSSYGRVKSKRSRKILKLWLSKFGYYNCKICINNKEYVKRVNRLVAELFIPNKYNLPCVNHKDENKSNNNVNNLEWCDAKYNVNYGTRNERAAAKISQKNSKAVYCIELNKIFKSQTEAAKELGISQGNISSCLTGKYKTSGGYHWKYAETSVEEI